MSLQIGLNGAYVLCPPPSHCADCIKRPKAVWKVNSRWLNSAFLHQMVFMGIKALAEHL